MEITEFFKNLGLMILGIAFIGGFGYWTFSLINKIKPDIKFQLIYNVFGKKFNENYVKQLMDYNQAGLSVDQVNKFLLIKGNFDKKQVKELCWIFKQIQKKGGKNKNE